MKKDRKKNEVNYMAKLMDFLHIKYDDKKESYVIEDTSEESNE
jgi:hypothetical protein